MEGESRREGERKKERGRRGSEEGKEEIGGVREREKGREGREKKREREMPIKIRKMSKNSTKHLVENPEWKMIIKSQANIIRY